MTHRVEMPVDDNARQSAARREHRGLLFGLLAAAIWGGYLVATRHGIATGLMAHDLAFLRYATAGVIMAPWLLRHAPLSLAGIGWLRGVSLSILGGPAFVLVGASGFLFAPLAHSAVIQLGTLTLVAILLAALLAGDPPGFGRMIGMLIIVAGLALISGPELLQGGSSAWRGDLLFALAGTMWALFTVLQRIWRVDPFAATAVVSCLSCLLYSPIYLIWYGSANLFSVSVWYLVYQVLILGFLSGVVALYAFSQAVEYLGAARASLFPALAPAVAIGVGVPIVGEIPSLGQLVGLAVLSVGLLIAVRPSR